MSLNSGLNLANTFKRFGISSLLLTIVMFLLCGFIYPLVMTGLGSVIFPSQSKGSVIVYDNMPIGTQYVGQDFRKPYFLWGRPSAVGYNIYVETPNGNKTLDGDDFEGVSSGSENFAPSNPALKERVEATIKSFTEANPTVKASDIPADLVTSSGSGLDPNISVQSAMIQVPRIAHASHLSEAQVKEIIHANTEYKLGHVFGNDRVNVLKVNIDIAKAMKK